MSLTRSIWGRVVLATTLAAVLAGATVAIVGLALDHLLAAAREDARLTEAAQTLAAELLDPHADPAWVAADETRELAGTGIVVAVFEGNALLAGEQAVRRPTGGACAELDTLRVCEVEAGPWVAVAGRASALHAEQRATFALALALAVLFSTLSSALGARLVARWSVAPLVSLTDRVGALDLEHVSSAQLGAPSDVQEVEALRAALARTLDELALALEHARRFAGHAAHELRTPLTAIAGELELTAENVSAADDVESITRAQRTVARLSRLVERLLALSRPRGDLAREPLVVAELLEELIAELPSAQRDRVQVVASSALVSGDRALLGAMISAGLDNALKFSEGPVEVRVEERAGRVVLEIDDEGPGVPLEARERVFEAFERGAQRGAARGHGLGLALVRHVASLHGGSARFVEGAHGARLRMELPGEAR